MSTTYNIHVEQGVICVAKDGASFTETFYFDSANSAEDNAQELAELLIAVGVKVRMKEGWFGI